MKIGNRIVSIEQYNKSQIYCIRCDRKFPDILHKYILEFSNYMIFEPKMDDKIYTIIYECPFCFKVQWCHGREMDLRLFEIIQNSEKKFAFVQKRLDRKQKLLYIDNRRSL